MRNKLPPFTGLEILMMVMIALFISIAVLFPPVQCRWTAEAMQKKHLFYYSTGCLIENNPGQYIPLKNYRVIP